MSFNIGIIGLPNAGKSTLFKAITKKEALIASYPFTTIEPNTGIAEVSDKRLFKIAEKINPKEVIPASLEFIDIAGLIEGAHQGEGLGNQFLSHINECDALVQVLNAFEKEDPEKDKQTVREELFMKDIQVVEKMIEKTRKKGGINGEETSHLEDVKKKLEKREVPTNYRDMQILSAKPVIYLYNIRTTDTGKERLCVNLKIEEELTELSDKEKEELGLSSSLDHLIKECYNLLGLITFFTVAGGEKAQAWPLKKGENILCAAEKVHSDFKQKFIRAEVISFPDFLSLESLPAAKKQGKIKTAGKSYIVQDGDIIEFKI